MRLSTSTCMYFNRPEGKKADILETLSTYRNAGYHVMDINFHDAAMFRTPMWEDDWLNYVNRLRDKAQELGIEFSQAHSHFYNYCNPNEPKAEWHEEQVRRDIVSAGVLGVKWVVIHAATDWNSPTLIKSSLEKGKEYFKHILELAAKNNVGIAIENLWEVNIAPKRRYTSFAEELVELVDSLPYENLGICWDFEHAAAMKQDQMKALELVGDRLKATHVSDYYDVGYDHVLPYHGTADIDEMLRALAQIDYKGDFTYEVFRHTMRLPEGLVLPALRYSFSIGEYLISRHEKFRKEYLQK